MAATFGNLDLESLGTVGEPSVEYAKFETKVSEPDGYDGGVLANFRRGATKIKFNLALDGDRAALVSKMNQLAAELGKGQQELVLPNMTEGYHFDASANCVLHPVEYVDGFVLPLEFVVPRGLAEKKEEYTLQKLGSERIANNGIYPARMVFKGTTIAECTGLQTNNVVSIYGRKMPPSIGWQEGTRVNQNRVREERYTVEEGWTFSYDTDTYSVDSNAGLFAIAAFDVPMLGSIPAGEEWEVIFSVTGTAAVDYLPTMELEVWSVAVW